MPGNPLLDVNNLSDVSDAATARANLEVDSKEEGQARVDVLGSYLSGNGGDGLIGSQASSLSNPTTQKERNLNSIETSEYTSPASGIADLSNIISPSNYSSQVCSVPEGKILHGERSFAGLVGTTAAFSLRINGNNVKARDFSITGETNNHISTTANVENIQLSGLTIEAA